MNLNTTSLRQGRIERGSSALKMIGNAFYSYSTKIAEIRIGTLYCNPRKYSPTTSKQMTALKNYYIRQGCHITEIGWQL